MRFLLNHFILFFISILVIYTGCDKGNVTTLPSDEDKCGVTKLLSFPSYDYYSTTLSNGYRKYNLEFLDELQTIDNICTFKHPSVTATAWWTDSIQLHDFELRLLTEVHPLYQPYSDFGTKSAVSWNGHLEAGLSQAYHDGPGKIYYVTVEVSFSSKGSFEADTAYFNSAKMKVNGLVSYYAYKQPSLSNQLYQNDIMSVIIKGNYYIIDKKPVSLNFKSL